MNRDAPNFFIIGAAKSGTTSLAEALRRHPDVFVSRVKEPQFFSVDALWDRGVGDYVSSHFSGAGRFSARGEATPHYLVFEKAARRIREALPPESHRFVAIFRDPVARAYSLYRNMVSEGFEELSFEEALAREAERSGDPDLEARGSLLFRYYGSGLYARQLEAYFRHFDRERFLLLLQEDLIRDPADVLRRLCRFLDVREDVDLRGAEVANPAGEPRSMALQRFLRQPHWIKEPLKRILPEPVRLRLARRVLDANKRVGANPAMDPDTERALRERFRDDVTAFAAIVGRDLSHWLPSDDAGAANRRQPRDAS